MILVTGAAGYVGHTLVRRLVDAGQPVRAMVHSPARAEARLADVRDRIEMVPGDVTRPDTLPPALDGVQAVVHLVAIAIEKGGATYEKINTDGTINLIEAAKAARVRRFVNMSQNGADSASPYRFLRSKGKAQDAVAASGLDWTALKPSVIWGPQDEFANVQARLIRLTPLIFPVPGDGQARFQPVWVGDVVEAIARSLEDNTTIGHAYELGGPEVLTYDEIVQRVLAALNTRRALIHTPVPLMALAVRAMQLLPNPPVTPSLLDLLKVDNAVADNALTAAFGITPRAFVPENLGYMRQFTALGTLRRLLGQSVEEAQP
ncbi:MAG TPA: complex I NDUFA9 subunit family protein [Aggregatilinea sp.]|uniref:complex I NDUFA9 subunit family protein n=1 Tax=Aggregatilinea sp. TaxID=2806333 RepID=UPI002CFEBC72|nr:complex I NDUFA9 subunit family protein [Aggregatilinea sp.]HML21285.1 complex I NDUFA9 subunit family protein [Aggregatilinea sp.]